MCAGKPYAGVARTLQTLRLHTVCQSARCPNRLECWESATATFMILGAVCTRACRFCAVTPGLPAPPDPDEPARLAEAAVRMELRHVVITSVTRDDLPDGGAGHFAACIQAVRRRLPPATIEVLVPDFLGAADAIQTVARAGPDVFNHNLETVDRLQPEVRPQAGYQRTLAVLRTAAAFFPRPLVKSGLMLGLGETEAELKAALHDLLAAGCDLLTLGQYLAPDRTHWPVARQVPPEEFDRVKAWALAAGFKGVAAAPLVRSSFQAARLLAQAAAEAAP